MSLSESESRVCNIIASRSAEMLEQLAAHVSIPTGLNYTQGLNEYRRQVVARLESIGATCTTIPGDPRPAWLTTPGQAGSRGEVPPTVVLERLGVAGGPRVMLAGHLDTVHDPAGPFRTLTLESDGIARGPGAADMKGGILVALIALEALDEARVGLNWSFLLNSDEETGSFHSAGAIRSTARSHDVGLALEPALPDGSLVVERMGTGQFKIECFGRSAHVGRDFTRGVSAVNALAETIVAASKLARPQEGMILNIGPLQGSAVTNAVADHAAAWGNVRYVGPDQQQMLHAGLQQLEVESGPIDGLPRIAIHRDFNRAAKPRTPQVMKLAELARVSAESLGQKLPFASTGGVCDGNIMQEAGLPTIDTLGVRGGNLHRADEYIEVASLVERAQLLAVLLCRLQESRP